MTTGSAWWIDGPLIWLLTCVVFVLLVCVNAERRERALKREEALKPLAPVIPLKGHRHD